MKKKLVCRKARYQKPVIEKIHIDNEISLVMVSYPPDDPPISDNTGRFLK